MKRILNGNEILIQGGLEAGFDLYTGYPGSPLADFFNILYQKKDRMQAQVVIANSEANAAAMASGAKMAGQNTLIAMKSMGLHVASDALSVGNFADPGESVDGRKAGVVVAVGDDPWSISTSTPADSRYLFKHLHIPFLEPSTPQELKDWMKLTLELSQKSSVYWGVLLTTFMAEGGGRVDCYDEINLEKSPLTLDPESFNLQKNVMVPPNSLIADQAMIENRFPQAYQSLKELKLEQSLGEGQVGFIACGAVYETLKQYLEENNFLQKVKLIKIATPYPLIKENLIPLLQGLEKIIVVEEKRGFLEESLRALIQSENLSFEIFGKKFGEAEGFPSHGGLSYEILDQKIKEISGSLGLETNQVKQVEVKNLKVPLRLPTFCPGCPHRETLSLLKDLRAKLAGKGMNLISHGDVGCYSLSFLEPFKEMHDLSAMGQGGALAAGTDLFTTNPSLVLMGDSTFFHSGVSAISNSVQCDHNITYILLDNDNTAMTGHQMTPRTGVSVEGVVRPRQDMLETVQSLGVNYSLEVNPSDRYFYKNVLEDVIERPGVKVIVSNKECALTFHGRKKKKDRDLFAQDLTKSSEVFYQINTLACEDCRACVDLTGCPGLTQVFDAYGTKVAIDPQICVADSYCTKIKACPSFEEVIVQDYHPTKHQNLKKFKLDDIPLPDKALGFEQILKGNPFRVIVIGVGGSGVTTISRILAEAALEMDERFDFKFVDQKGLAQRNGSVTSHLSFFLKERSHGQTNPKGSCDLVLSPDLIEGGRAAGFLSPDGLLAIDSESQIPLSVLLERSPGESQEDLAKRIQKEFSNQVQMFSLKRLSYELWGKSVYSCSMLVGLAFQAGQLPFSLENLRQAIKRAVPKKEVSSNLEAFEWGRKVFLDQKIPEIEKEKADELQLLRKSVGEAFLFSPSKMKARFDTSLETLSRLFPFQKREHLGRYLHDILVYQGEIQDFLKASEILKEKLADLSDKALRTLAKTYWIKDEVFVSHLMVSPLKEEEDKQRFGNLGGQYSLKRINRPAFDFMGKKIEFDISPKAWMLKFMRHCRFLRTMLPAWHSKEKELAAEIREILLTKIESLDLNQKEKVLEDLDNIKGYREYRYERAQELLPKVREKLTRS